MEYKLAAVLIEFRPQHIGLAADLAILDVTLARTRGFVHGGFIPFAAARALEAGKHS